jgi:GNAT superfamily N-acetyltransferase
VPAPEPIVIHSTSTPGIFVTASLARRIEHAEATLIEDGARAAMQRLEREQVLLRHLAGGVVAFTEAGSPFNKVAGLGFDGVPDESPLDDIEREFSSRESAVQIEVSSLGDPAIARLLTRRGYELVNFENVLGLPLAADMAAGAVPPGAYAPFRITSARPQDNALWLDTVATGFLHPDTFDGPASHETFCRDALERVFADTLAAPSFERYLAWRGNEVAGGASLRVFDGIAQLCGAATLSSHRRQGVQTALLRHRLATAADRGCDLAVVTTQPGSKSQQNVQRFGFTLLYARAILVKPAPLLS